MVVKHKELQTKVAITTERKVTYFSCLKDLFLKVFYHYFAG